MRYAFPEKLEAGRIHDGPYASPAHAAYGAFKITGPCGATLIIIASDGSDLKEKWQHVSVSIQRRPPNWQEMCFVKSLFWDDDELVIQFHPPLKDYVNCHPNCLHLWKPPFDVALPPSILVGPKLKEGDIND
jgi:hypothetical protein